MLVMDNILQDWKETGFLAALPESLKPFAIHATDLEPPNHRDITYPPCWYAERFYQNSALFAVFR